VAVLGATATIASAHRRAIRAEKVAMMYHAGSHYAGLPAKQVDAPKAYPPTCAKADIATVVKGSAWGAWSFNPRAKAKKCAKWGSNGWVIEHKLKGKWYVVAEGSELPGKVKGVPHKIAVDLVDGLG
jgi:hypothetical protein